ncbi:MAG: hypothetical protein PWP20_1655 [Eubacteriaceae bacterium]|nr:hypothetical protein [Eubacteriaceae bacterium]
MPLFMDIASDSVNKVNEELCGDNVEIRINDESIIVVLADGLGSGVKANILSTLTSTIAATMLEEKMTIQDVLETLEATLPECQVRKLAYSTFTIVQIFRNRMAYIVEFDNPPLVFIRDGEVLGWEWDEAADYVLARTYEDKRAKEISMALIDTCYQLYGEKPGDDTTVAVIRAEERKYLTIFTGPPLDQSRDSEIKKLLDLAKGKKIVCGGTAGNIVAREYDEEIKIDLSTMSEQVPPIGRMKSIDLVTEGVLTIQETVRLIESYLNNEVGSEIFRDKNAAAILANYLINESTNIDIIMGNSINPAHQNPDFPEALSSKWRITQKLISLLEKFNKDIHIIYI